MGAAYHIVLEKQIEGLDTMMDGKRLSKNIESLDTIAREPGVRPLDDFISMDADAIKTIFGDDAEGIEVPPMKQFSAEDGLTTIRALCHDPKRNRR